MFHMILAVVCIYASKKECATSYASIFNGNDSLKTVFDAFGPTVGLNLFFTLLRSGM